MILPNMKLKKINLLYNIFGANNFLYSILELIINILKQL